MSATVNLLIVAEVVAKFGEQITTFIFFVRRNVCLNPPFAYAVEKNHITYFWHKIFESSKSCVVFTSYFSKVFCCWDRSVFKSSITRFYVTPNQTLSWRLAQKPYCSKTSLTLQLLLLLEKLEIQVSFFFFKRITAVYCCKFGTDILPCRSSSSVEAQRGQNLGEPSWGSEASLHADKEQHNILLR